MGTSQQRMSRPVAQSTIKEPSPARSVSSKSNQSKLNDTSVFLGPNDTTINDTLIYERTLNVDVDFKDKDQLVSELEAAKIELEALKKDHIVIANNRTVKRLLDHVKIEGTQNLSHTAKIGLQKDGEIVTKYKDELHEKTRENAEVTARLVKLERELYETSSIHNELKIKIGKLEEENRRHKQIYLNRNIELRKRAKKFEDAIFKEQYTLSNINKKIISEQESKLLYEKKIAAATLAAQAPDIEIVPEVQDKEELEASLMAARLRKTETLKRVESKKMKLKLETAALISKVKKAKDEREHVSTSREKVDNKIDDVTSKLESDIDFKEVSSKRIDAKKRVTRQRNENLKQSIELMRLEVTILNQRVDTHNDQLVAAAEAAVESDFDFEDLSMASMASDVVETSTSFNSEPTTEIRGVRMGKSIHPGRFQSMNHKSMDFDDGIQSIESVIRNAPLLVDTAPVSAPHILRRRSNSRETSQFEHSDWNRTPNLISSRQPQPTIRKTRIIRQDMM